jgi:hypothetical protein
MKNRFAPIFLTPPEYWSKEEWNKSKSRTAFKGKLRSGLSIAMRKLAGECPITAPICLRTGHLWMTIWTRRR